MELTANGTDIHYQLEGEGPVVTLSHSLACNFSMWDEQVDALKARYRVLRYDIRGHGDTSAPPAPYTLEGLTDDLHALLTELGIERTHFVGLSMGGMIGQMFALAHPDMVQSLVLCDTTSRWPKESAPMWEQRINTVQEGGMEPMVEPTIERWFTEPFRQQRRDVTDRIRKMIRATPLQGYIGCCHAIPKIDTTDQLEAIQCPSLIIVGEQDPATPVEMARTIHDGIPSSGLEVLPSASHLSNVEQPAAFNRALTGFLENHAP
ncbi:MAG: 3-oxoadipate enol-lactonase [Acidiferrobacterales bacterium]